MAYPIENIWCLIKPRIKRKEPQTLDELKRVALEKWNSIPTTIVENLTKGYINRVKKVIELKGERLESEYILKK